MSGRTPDPRLEALLRDLPPPPPVPADLAARVLAAAATAPQEPRPARARRAVARRDRRGRWLRRPLLAGTAALGLLVTSAVAATLAGVPIPQKIAAVFFPAEKAPEPKQAPAPQRRAARPAAPPAAAPAPPVETAEAEPLKEGAPWQMRPNPWRRLFMAQRIIAARRAMGLPTPGADRIERQLRRRAELWHAATPEQRAQWLERQRARRETRRAMLATPEGQAALAARQEQREAWRAQRQAGIPLTPEQRLARQQLIRQWRAERRAGILLTPEERAARREQFRAWRSRQEAGLPMSEEERAFRQERLRRWREARGALLQERPGPADGEPAAGAEAASGRSREGEGS